MSEPASAGQVSSVVTTLQVKPGVDQNLFVDKLITLSMDAAKSGGFWSAEVIPPKPGEDPEWQLVQRFASSAAADMWRSCALRNKILDELCGDADEALAQMHAESPADDSSEAATAIVTYVHDGMEDRYFEWAVKIQRAQAKFAGFRGCYLQPPTPGRSRQWATLLRFDSPALLEVWLNCPERKELLLEANEFVKETKFREVSTSFPGWVPLDESTGSPPPNWKTFLMVMLGLYPVVALLTKFVGPLTESLPLALGLFIRLMASVAATTWVTMPLCIRWFGWWLFPKGENREQCQVSGLAIVIGLFVVEIAGCWFLLMT